MGHACSAITLHDGVGRGWRKLGRLQGQETGRQEVVVVVGRLDLDLPRALVARCLWRGFVGHVHHQACAAPGSQSTTPDGQSSRLCHSVEKGQDVAEGRKQSESEEQSRSQRGQAVDSRK